MSIVPHMLGCWVMQMGGGCRAECLPDCVITCPLAVGPQCVLFGVACTHCCPPPTHSPTHTHTHTNRYTPDHMAVVIVGDFPDPTKVVDMIHKHLDTAFETAAAAAAGGQDSSSRSAASAVPPPHHPPLPVVSPSDWQHTEPRCVCLVWRTPCVSV